MQHLPRILLALIFLTVLSACGRRAKEKMVEKAIERQIGEEASVRMSDDTLHVKTDKGEFTVASGKAARLPDNFPKDVPLYKGATIEMSMQVPEGHSLVLKTADAPTAVSDFYAREMTARGWKQQETFNLAGQSLMAYEKGGRNAVIAVGAQDRQTLITLTIGREEESSSEVKTAEVSKQKAPDDKGE